MRREPWGLIVYNKDKQLFAFTGRLFDDTKYSKEVEALIESGHNFQCQTYELKDENRLKNENEIEFKRKLVSIEEIFNVEPK